MNQGRISGYFNCSQGEGPSTAVSSPFPFLMGAVVYGEDVCDDNRF
jgi:hypothetical protein